MWKSGQHYKGAYIGTEIDEIWWKRYKQDKMFARGNGKFWFDDKGIYFHRYLTKTPMFIPFNLMQEFKISTWHAGRWSMGIPILKIVWRKNFMLLSSGFIVSKDRNDVIGLINVFRGSSQTASYSQSA